MSWRETAARIAGNVARSEPTKPPKPPDVDVLSVLAVQDQPAFERSSLELTEAQQTRRMRLLAMLDANPDRRLVALSEDAQDGLNVLIAIGIRSVATAEYLIPKSKWDGILFIEQLDKHCQSGGEPH